jgi:putative pyoverdin transport system ATP-binding/permease protein
VNLFYLLLRTSWVTVLLAGISGLLNGGSTAGLIALINAALNNVGQPRAWTSWGFIGFGAALLVTHFSSQILLVRASQGAIFHLRMLLSQQILASPLRSLEDLGNPKLLATLTDDVESVARSFAVLPGLFNAIAIVAGCLIYMGLLSWIAFVVLLGLIIFGVITYEFLAMRASRFIKLARQEQDRLFQHFRALMEGNKELKLNRQRRQAFLNSELKATATASRRHNLRGMTVFAIAASWGQLLLFITIGFFLFTLPHLVQVRASVLSGYVLSIVYLMMPMQQVIEAVPVLTKASVALKKIDSLQLTLANQSTDIQQNAEHQQPLTFRTLTLANITHTYPGNWGDNSLMFSLGPLDFSFQAGEIVFIVGGNGSGKSTLGKIITGLYAPELGDVYLDEHLITDQNREWYRQHFSVVFADFYLFDRLLGLETVNLDNSARDYLQKLKLSHKVRIEQGALSTTALSQGERKRLALLTAYLEDRPIYLFDEWAADQDPSFRELFYTQMLPEMRQRGKTIFVISHDDRYFHLCDRIIKLDYGKLEYEKRPSV